MSTRGLGQPKRPVRYPALRAAVEAEMDRRDWQIADLAESSGLSVNTLRDLGVREPDPRTVEALAVLGFSPARVDTLKAGGLMAGESGWDEVTLTVASLVASLPAPQRCVVLDLVRSMITHSNQSD